MEVYIQKAMNDEVIKRAAKLYGVSFKDIKKLGGFENFIFEYTLDNKNYILRFVHSRHREFDQVLAELEFIDYLDNNDARVSTVIHSKNDKLVEKLMLNDIDYFSISAFTKAPGRNVQKEELTNDFFIMFGKEVGKLHRLTKDFVPKHKRYAWDEENFLDIAKNVLTKEDDIIIKKLIKTMKYIQKLPKNVDNYGLIHTDLHFGNMFYHNGTLTFFDWDDASYKHFISDIAIIIFYMYWLSPKSDKEIAVETNKMLKLLMKGYTKECPFESNMWVHLNEFLSLRTIILYVVLLAAGEDINQDFVKMYISKYRDRIINEIPFFDLKIALDGVYNGVY